jgi:hypothetical protein
MLIINEVQYNNNTIIQSRNSFQLKCSNNNSIQFFIIYNNNNNNNMFVLYFIYIDFLDWAPLDIWSLRYNLFDT